MKLRPAITTSSPRPNFSALKEKLLEERPLEQWKTYMRWQVIHRAAPYLNKAMVDENFDFLRTR